MKIIDSRLRKMEESDSGPVTGSRGFYYLSAVQDTSPTLIGTSTSWTNAALPTDPISLTCLRGIPKVRRADFQAL